MASRRIVTSLLLRTSRSHIITRSIPSRSQCIAQTCRTQAPLAIRNIQRRWNSNESGSNKAYEFQDIVELIESPEEGTVLIDTREPSELIQTGRIPGALNIPVSSQADAYFITDEEFVDRFGFERPGKDCEVVFYCKAGVRSRAAAGLARQGGWKRVGEYSGSWLDWEKRGGEVEK